MDYSLFENQIWPILAERVPLFQSLKLINGWAGFYDLNLFDQNAIIGRHYHISNFYFGGNGLSGHGLQHSPAIGNALSELILDGRVFLLKI